MSPSAYVHMLSDLDYNKENRSPREPDTSVRLEKFDVIELGTDPLDWAGMTANRASEKQPEASSTETLSRPEQDDDDLQQAIANSLREQVRYCMVLCVQYMGGGRLSLLRSLLTHQASFFLVRMVLR